MKLVYCSNGPIFGATGQKAKGDLVEVGDKVTTERHGEVEVKSIEKPRSPASTGRVYIGPVGSDQRQGYYPVVIDAEWIEREDRVPTGHRANDHMWG